MQIFVTDDEEMERQTIELVVLVPVENQPPVFPEDPYRFELPENATASTALGSLGVTDEGGRGPQRVWSAIDTCILCIKILSVSLKQKMLSVPVV